MSESDSTTTFDDLPDPALRKIFCRNFQCTSFQNIQTGTINTEYIQICKRYKCLYDTLEKSEIASDQVEHFIFTLLTRHFDPLLVKHEEVAKPFNSTLWFIVAKYKKENDQVECDFAQIIPYGIRACTTQFHLYIPKERAENDPYQDAARNPNMDKLNESFPMTDEGKRNMYQRLTENISLYMPCSLSANEHLRIALQFIVKTDVRVRETRVANNMKHLFNSGSMLALKEYNSAFNKIIWDYVKSNLSVELPVEAVPAAAPVQPELTPQQRMYNRVMRYYEGEQRLVDVNNTTPMQLLFDYILNYAKDYNNLVIRGGHNGGSHRKSKRKTKTTRK